MKEFIDMGARNKGTYWEWVSAWSFAHTKLPDTAYDVPAFFGYGEGQPNNHCHSAYVIKNTKELIIKEFEEGMYTEKFFEDLHDVYDSSLVEIKELLKESFEEDTGERLAEKINFVAKKKADSLKPMLFALKSQYIQDYFEDLLKETLENSDVKEERNFKEITSLLLTPTVLTAAQLEEEKIFKLLESLKGSGGKTTEDLVSYLKSKEGEELLTDLVNSIGWFHMEYSKDPKTKEEYVSDLCARVDAVPVDEMPSPIQARMDIKKNQKAFFDTHKNSEKLKELSRVLQGFSYILDASKVMEVEAFFLSLPLLKHVARKLGIGDYKDMLYLVPPEIEKYLIDGTKADKELIETRKKHRAVLMRGKTITVYEGEKAKQLGEQLVECYDAEDLDEVKGVVSFPGIVQGKVTIVRGIEDKDKFEDGDIFVAVDGPAEFTIFLKKASAIVCEQGGMISHASIMAREMKKPCIVATKVATKVFKDGDMVEVNADEGIVRKL